MAIHDHPDQFSTAGSSTTQVRRSSSSTSSLSTTSSSSSSGSWTKLSTGAKEIGITDRHPLYSSPRSLPPSDLLKFWSTDDIESDFYYCCADDPDDYLSHGQPLGGRHLAAKEPPPPPPPQQQQQQATDNMRINIAPAPASHAADFYSPFVKLPSSSVCAGDGWGEFDLALDLGMSECSLLMMDGDLTYDFSPR